MIFEYIMDGSSASLTESVVMIVFMAVAALFCIALRNYVRARVTVKLSGGDEKVKFDLLKALNLPNIISVVILAIFSVSWTRTPKSELTRGKNVLIALSAPLTSFVLAAANMLIYQILYVIEINIYVAEEEYPTVLLWISLFFSSCILVNIAYTIFGLIPIPGTDGGLVIAQILPENMRKKFLDFDRFSYLVLLFIAIISARSGFGSTVISTVATAVQTPFLALSNLLFPIN